MKQPGRPRAAGRRTSRARVQANPSGRNGGGLRAGREVERLQDELNLQRHYADGDLAARRDLESKLSQYADLYDFAPVGHVTFDFQGRILELNLTGANMIGYDRLEVIGRPFLALLEQGGQAKVAPVRLRVPARTASIRRPLSFGSRLDMAAGAR